MKAKLSSLIVICVLTFSGSAFAANTTPAKARTISDVSTIPHRVLKRAISPKFYQTLVNSPIEGYVAVRAQLYQTHLSGIRIVHSELNGAYDSLALERARAVSIQGYAAVDKINPTGRVLVHLLIYKTADGILALSFAQIDEPAGDQQDYYGCANLAVRKNDGRWVAIKSVDSLEGKGLVLRTQTNSKRAIWFFATFGVK